MNDSMKHGITKNGINIRQTIMTISRVIAIVAILILLLRNVSSDVGQICSNAVQPARIRVHCRYLDFDSFLPSRPLTLYSIL